MLSKGTVKQVSQDSPGFYGHIFVAPKASGGWHPELDLSLFSRFLKRISFKIKTPLFIRAAVRPGDWATSIDLKDAYFHIVIHRRNRKRLRFVW